MTRILCILRGGLGNQLFQYAAALTVRNHLDKTIRLTFSSLDNKHNTNRFDYVSMLFTEGVYTEPTTVTIFADDGNSFRKWEPDEYKLDDIILMQGYYQYLPAILYIIPFLRISILQNLLKVVQPAPINQETTGFVHVRRGDFLNPDQAQFHWTQPIEYYELGMQILEYKNPNIKSWLIFSDDTDWCATSFTKKNIIILTDMNELQTLYCMIQCKAGAVISNSTFSWWGAILGENNKVVYPKNWYGDAKPTLFPEGWICL
uniref:Glycosyltransferase n=1 Tax=viral metagenome TaxID=1070528 RepID=A0A6C0BCB8_9ZZZZ